MKEDVVVAPAKAADAVAWFTRTAAAWAGTGLPIILDVSSALWVGHPGEMVDLLKRLGVSVSGVCTGSDLVPLPPGIRRVRTAGLSTSWCVCPDFDVTVISERMRGGQVFEVEGDVRVQGDVAPGAEIFAGGSVVVDGVVRGRVMAGRRDLSARILCRSIQAEMVSIGDFHVAGERIKEEWWGAPVSVSLRKSSIRIEQLSHLPSV